MFVAWGKKYEDENKKKRVYDEEDEEEDEKTKKLERVNQPIKKRTEEEQNRKRSPTTTQKRPPPQKMPLREEKDDYDYEYENKLYKRIRNDNRNKNNRNDKSGNFVIRLVGGLNPADDEDFEEDFEKKYDEEDDDEEDFEDDEDFDEEEDDYGDYINIHRAYQGFSQLMEYHPITEPTPAEYLALNQLENIFGDLYMREMSTLRRIDPPRNPLRIQQYFCKTDAIELIKQYANGLESDPNHIQIQNRERNEKIYKFFVKEFGLHINFGFMYRDTKNPRRWYSFQPLSVVTTQFGGVKRTSDSLLHLILTMYLPLGDGYTISTEAPQYYRITNLNGQSTKYNANHRYYLEKMEVFNTIQWLRDQATIMYFRKVAPRMMEDEIRKQNNKIGKILYREYKPPNGEEEDYENQFHYDPQNKKNIIHPINIHAESLGALRGFPKIQKKKEYPVEQKIEQELELEQEEQLELEYKYQLQLRYLLQPLHTQSQLQLDLQPQPLSRKTQLDLQLQQNPDQYQEQLQLEYQLQQQLDLQYNNNLSVQIQFNLDLGRGANSLFHALDEFAQPTLRYETPSFKIIWTEYCHIVEKIIRERNSDKWTPTQRRFLVLTVQDLEKTRVIKRESLNPPERLFNFLTGEIPLEGNLSREHIHLLMRRSKIIFNRQRDGVFRSQRKEYRTLAQTIKKMRKEMREMSYREMEREMREMRDVYMMTKEPSQLYNEVDDLFESHRRGITLEDFVRHEMPKFKFIWKETKQQKHPDLIQLYTEKLVFLVTDSQLLEFTQFNDDRITPENRDQVNTFLELNNKRSIMFALDAKEKWGDITTLAELQQQLPVEDRVREGYEERRNWLQTLTQLDAIIIVYNQHLRVYGRLYLGNNQNNLGGEWKKNRILKKLNI